MLTPPPDEIDWGSLSPRCKAILAWVAVPLEHGLTHAQLAEQLNLRRPEIPDLPLPSVVTDGWVSIRMRELRARPSR